MYIQPPPLRVASKKSTYLKDSRELHISKGLLKKHCEILVSCSDEERNCIQTLETACKLVKLHASSWIFM